jgi:ribosomal-protein-alanine N-acetyltransferase
VNELRVLPARLPDSREIAALAAQVLPEAWTAEQLVAEIAMPEGCVRVARSPAGALLGFLVGRRVLAELHVLLVGVAPHARRAGVGSALVRCALGEIPPPERCFLEVREGNSGARAFYQKLGFREDGRRPGHYGGGEAAVLMSRSLPRG